MSGTTPRNQNPGAALVAQEAELAHRALRAHFERIEQALRQGDLKRGAHLLSELIAQAREHFLNEENIAEGAGLAPSAGGRMLHDALIARAHSLKARCLNSPANTDLNHNIETELVVLLSDLVESDLRIEHRVNEVPEPAAE